MPAIVVSVPPFHQATKDRFCRTLEKQVEAISTPKTGSAMTPVEAVMIVYMTIMYMTMKMTLTKFGVFGIPGAEAPPNAL